MLHFSSGIMEGRVACLGIGAKERGKEKWQYDVMVFKCLDVIVLTGRQNESMCCTRRGDGQDVGFWGIFFPQVI